MTIHQQISYERNLHRSYMKIPAIEKTCIDEQIILRRELKGIIPIEKCYINGQGQYWYNITGKQALDYYCKIASIGQQFFETLILRICDQLETLEWNLIDAACLMVNPEFIFVENNGEDIFFVLYPDCTQDFFVEFRQLMEFLLTKLNHEEESAIHSAYPIYEITLQESYCMEDLKKAILKRRTNIKKEERPDVEAVSESMYAENDIKEEELEKESKTEVRESLFLEERFKKIKHFLEKYFKRNNKEKIPYVVYPEDEEEQIQPAVHPTVCLSIGAEKQRGVLIYEGREAYPDFELEKMTCVIGKSHQAGLCIEKETISSFHAKIEYWDDGYYIEDMNSTNGTFVNEVMLTYKERKLLYPGDVIRFADVKYRFL